MNSSKENMLKTLEKSGWHVKPEALDEILAENPKINTNELTKLLLNSDFKNVSAKCFADDVLQGKTENLTANHVLQLAKLRNISAPKENEHSHSAPKIFKINLTDGTSNYTCLILNDVKNLNLNTPPGTKIHLNGSIRIKCNMFLLDGKNTSVLGGHVDYLVEKWKANKELTNHVRAVGMTDTAPPPWLPFGTQQKNLVDTSKKVFADSQKQEEDESSEFFQARQAALAEALEAKSKISKTFTQQTIDKTQINQPPPQTMRVATSVQPSSAQPSGNENKRESKNNRRKGRRGDRSDEEDYADAKDAARPSEVTFFDLFKTKLDLNDNKTQQSNQAASNYNDYDTDSYQRPMSQSYSRNNPRSNQYQQERPYQQQDRPYQQQDRQYQQQERPYQQQDRQYQQQERPYQQQERPFQRQDRQYQQQERPYQQQDRQYQQQDRSYQQQDRQYPQQDRSYQQQDRQYPQQERSYQPRQNPRSHQQRSQNNRYQNQQQRNQADNKNKQVYNPNDFNFDLGGAPK